MSKGFPDNVQQTLAKASNLEHLSLAFRLPAHTVDADDIDQGQVYLSSRLADQHYTRLKSMELKGWILPQVAPEEFLARHASTLRNIRFINCHLLGDQLSLAKWGGTALSLQGIEISLISETKVYSLQVGEDDIGRKVPVDTALTSGHEPLWLAGRQNCIVRRSLAEPPRNDPAPDYMPWWKKATRKQC